MTRTRWLIVAAVLAVAVAVAWSARPHPITDADRVDRIAAELRCPVCQGLSVEDSPSDTARSMKALVATRVAEGLPAIVHGFGKQRMQALAQGWRHRARSKQAEGRPPVGRWVPQFAQRGQLREHRVAGGRTQCRGFQAPLL